MTTKTVEIPTEYTALVVHQGAVDNLTKAREQCKLVAAVYGETDPRTVKMTTSLMDQVTLLFGSFFGGKQTISKDSADLSLFVSSDTGFVFGMIFHRGVYDPLREHEGAINNSAESAVNHIHCKTCDEPVKRTDPTAHDGHILMVAPTWGTWSFHS